MPPIYGLEMGDADCYCHNANRGERHTLDALQVADGYVEHEIPLGWMLVNDGYGCGYEDLDRWRAGLRDRNITLGLWTSTGLADQAKEVRTGARVRKLDVAWVGPGYRFALDACRQAFEGIEAKLRRPGLRLDPGGLGRLAALRRALERRPGGQLGVHPLADPDLRRRHHVGPGLHHRRRRRHLQRQRRRRTPATCSGRCSCP